MTQKEKGYISEELRQHGDKNLHSLFNASKILPAIHIEMNLSPMQSIAA